MFLHQDQMQLEIPFLCFYLFNILNIVCLCMYTYSGTFLGKKQRKHEVWKLIFKVCSNARTMGGKAQLVGVREVGADVG